MQHANSVDPDEMQQYAAFHLGLHCLQKYLFRGFLSTKGLLIVLFFYHFGAAPV